MRVQPINTFEMGQMDWNRRVLELFPVVRTEVYQNATFCYDLEGNVLGGIVWQSRHTRYGDVEMHYPKCYLHS